VTWQWQITLRYRSYVLKPPRRAARVRLELEAQLRALLFRQKIRHLREDGAVERNGGRLPRHCVGRAHLTENLVQPRAHLFGIGPVGRHVRRSEQIGLHFLRGIVRVVALGHRSPQNRRESRSDIGVKEPCGASAAGYLSPLSNASW
jgi:hypothetical protein